MKRSQSPMIGHSDAEAETAESPDRSPFHAQFLYNPAGVGLCCHAPTILQTSGGDLLVAWYAYPDKENADGSIVIARRNVNVERWEPSQILPVESEFSAGNPVLFELKDGRVGLLYVLLKGEYWNAAEMYVIRSNDGGRGWNRPCRVGTPRGMMIRHRPIMLKNGNLMLPAYDEELNRSVMLTSAAPHTTWKESYRFEGLDLIQPILVRLLDASLLLFFRPSSQPRRIWRSRSADEGATWSVPVRTQLPCPLSGIAGYSAGEKVALVYNHTERHQRHPLSVAESSDGGITWSEPWHFEANEHEVSYPSFVLDRDNNHVHGVYTYNRRMIKYVRFGHRTPETTLK